MRLALAGMAGCVAGFACQSSAQTGPPSEPKNAQKGNVCWAPDALQGRADQKTIQKNIKKAYVPVPNLASFQPPSQPAQVGAIRRVKLPPNSKKLIAFTFDLCEQPY
ncbi:MAG: hypothetical protein ACREC6_02240, partial [Hyphomicrobiaceae bacterium]